MVFLYITFKWASVAGHRHFFSEILLGQPMVRGHMDLVAVVVVGLLAAELALVLEHVWKVYALHVVDRIAALRVHFAANCAGITGFQFV